MRFKSVLALCAFASCASSMYAEEKAGVEEMVVVASRLPAADYSVGRSLTVLNRDQIQDIGYGNAADLFRLVPGIAVNRQGGFGGLTQLRLRGAEANHILVLMDGIDASAAGTGEFDFSSLLSEDIERIEVLRGAQSGLYGSNALAGVISIHTRAPDEGFSTELGVEGGSHSTRQSSVSVSGGNTALKARLTFVDRRSDFDLSENDTLLGGEDDENSNRTVSGQLRAAVNEHLDLSLFGRLSDIANMYIYLWKPAWLTCSGGICCFRKLCSSALMISVQFCTI